MISYVTLGTNDLDRAAKYYDALLGELGAKRMMENERIILWGTPGAPMLAVCKPFDGSSASVGNGVMVALSASNAEQVKALYDRPSNLAAPDGVAYARMEEGRIQWGSFPHARPPTSKRRRSPRTRPRSW